MELSTTGGTTISAPTTSQQFMKTEGLLQYSQEPSTGPYPKPDESTWLNWQQRILWEIALPFQFSFRSDSFNEELRDVLLSSRA
jgi:hypothetical protein